MELQNQRIEAPFEYGIEVNPGSQVVLKSACYLANQDQVYKVPLFPTDINSDKQILLLQLPDKASQVFNSLSWMFLTAILFTSMLVITFIISIWVIIKQKNLSQMKNDFINNMTHEFKTPIATISLASDALNNPKVQQNEEQMRFYTQIIKNENSRMNQHIENVLQMAILDKEDFDLVLQKTDLHEIILKASDNFSLQLQSCNATLDTYLNAKNSIIMADETHIYHVIKNLIDNALKYSPENPEITIITENKDKHLIIKIVDKGIGMNKETQKHVFDKFYRANTGNLHDVKGFGLGLSYVLNIVKKHKGSIQVKSEVGKGSTFEIQLNTI